MRGYEIGKDDYLKRLARIEGQVRGLQRMISEDTYCIDVLTQVNAVRAALTGVAVGCWTSTCGNACVKPPRVMSEEPTRW
jgi:CsoR family transcriptional regulator, copper-sensing transcriptional repressor